MATVRQKDRDRAEQMVRSLGMDPLQLLSLDNPDNQYFFGPDECGVIFYTLAGKRALSLGDPVCRQEDLDRLIRAYIDFCNRREYRCVFNSVEQTIADALKSIGFLVAKYGEEGILILSEYDLSGGKKGALRRNVAKLDKWGCTCEEYDPEQQRDPDLEQEIGELQKAWHEDKKLSLTYSVGDLHFDHPCGRRYFVTRDKEGDLLTVVSFLPYRQKKGWCIDVMYRKPDGLTGAMEHTIISAAWKLKEEGAEEVSLNIAPLAGIDSSSPDANREEKLMHAAFDSLDYGYDFKGLYRFKEKFAPSEWKPRFLVYDHRISLVQLARSIADVKGASDPELWMKYGKFFLSYTLTPRKYQNEQKKEDTI